MNTNAQTAIGSEGSMVRSGRNPWVIVLLLFFAQIINYFDKVVVGIAAIPMMKDLGLSRSQYGFVAGSLYALYAVSGVFVGLFVVKHLMPKWLLTVLVLIWSLSQFPVVLTSALWVLIACRMTLGAGEGPIGGTVANSCFSWFPNDKRNLPIAICTLGNGVGILLGSPVLNYVVLTYGWRRAFLVCGVMGLLWLAFWIIFGADGPYLSAPASREQPVVNAAPQTSPLWRNKIMIASFVVAFCSLWTVGFSVAWMPSYLCAGLGYDAKLVGWLLSMIATMGSVLSFLIAGVSQALMSRGVSSRVARGFVNGLSLILGAISLCGSVALHAGTGKLTLLAIGFALPLVTFSIGPPIVAEAAPPEEGQRAIVVIYAACSLAGLISPIAASYLLQIGDAGGAHRGYDLALVSTAVVLLLGGVTALVWLRPAAEEPAASNSFSAMSSEQL